MSVVSIETFWEANGVEIWPFPFRSLQFLFWSRSMFFCFVPACLVKRSVLCRSVPQSRCKCHSVLFQFPVWLKPKNPDSEFCEVELVRASSSSNFIAIPLLLLVRKRSCTSRHPLVQFLPLSLYDIFQYWKACP